MLNFESTPCFTFQKKFLLENVFSANRCFPHVIKTAKNEFKKFSRKTLIMMSSIIGTVIYYSVHYCNLCINFAGLISLAGF